MKTLFAPLYPRLRHQEVLKGEGLEAGVGECSEGIAWGHHDGFAVDVERGVQNSTDPGH